MKNKRLLCVSTYINELDNIIDIGSDHGYLSIFLKRKYPNIKILATDISEKALSYAISNIKKEQLDIDTKVTDGLNDINLSDYNTLIIAGMGTQTILDILDYNLSNINKLVIQSNNELSLLRKSINKLGYYLEDTKVVLDKNKYYEVMLFKKSNKINTSKEIKYGITKKENKEYYEYLINKYQTIIKKLPSNEKTKLNEFNKKIDFYKSLI